MPPEREQPAGQFGPSFAWQDSPQFDIRTRKAATRGVPVVQRYNGATLDTRIDGRQYNMRFPTGLDGTQTLADDATPSVKGGGFYQTGGTTTITDFDDGVVGDVLYLEAKHSVTITHGSPIQLNGDANYTMVSGDTLVLAMFDDQVWVEIARGGQTPGGSTVRRYYHIEVFSPTATVATGDGKKYFHIPSDLNTLDLVEVHAEVITAGTTGTTDIQIHNATDTADMLSTKLTIDSGETGSDTAATAAVIDTANDDVATNDLIRVDIDAVSSTPPDGLLVTLGFE